MVVDPKTQQDPTPSAGPDFFICHVITTKEPPKKRVT